MPSTVRVAGESRTVGGTGAVVGSVPVAGTDVQYDTATIDAGGPTLLWFDPADEVEERALETLADRIALGWRTQAALQFPDRPLVAQVVESTEDDGPTVVLYTRKADAGAAGRPAV